ncbi:Maf family protein [Desulfolucanica intricata]|uniref:Maf family protein n=1 Tax=Desulfolucanica intricata TaxID=1285191 RepID=UPI00082B00C8|nr:Maf family protein [Desulfolucanica intricata]
MPQIILASASPRRKELLEQLKLSFEIKVCPVDERIPKGVKPTEYVEYLAERKAQAVAIECSRGIIIGADTIVVKDNRILGKPDSPAQAVEMLNFLSNSIHEVLTGVAVIDAATGQKSIFSERTEVTFKDLSKEDIEGYVRTGEPLDKAGAYAIQGLGSVLVKGIKGCYFNVVGLPVSGLAEVLKNFNVRIFKN